MMAKGVMAEAGKKHTFNKILPQEKKAIRKSF